LKSLLVDVERALARRAEEGAPARLRARMLAAGDGWSAQDIICTADRRDAAYEEHHPHVAVALVVAGSFQYRSPAGRALLTPGSVLLGNPDQPFTCAHDHAAGDRCVSFKYSPEFIEQIASDAGTRGTRGVFRIAGLPALPALSPVTARVCASLSCATDGAWEELAVELATRSLSVSHRASVDSGKSPPGAEARVTGVARLIERGPDDEPFSLHRLAREAGLSRYHFLRTFRRVIGVTPHQFVCRARLRRAAARLVEDGPPVIDVAFDSGFGDVSNFNRAFRREFGMSPRQYHRRFAS